jgi:putative FmdB family regulatory protein
MPLYEYTCRSCQNDFEALVRSDETPACPSCGGEKLEKRFSVPAAHTSGGQLPISRSESFGGCGRPQCGMGGCQGLE